MTRVIGPYGYLGADLCRRFVAGDAFAYLPSDVEELALVQVTESDTGNHSTVMGDRRYFDKFLAEIVVARKRGREDEMVALAQRDLSAILPIERQGWPQDWLDELQRLGRVADQRERSQVGMGGYL